MYIETYLVSDKKQQQRTVFLVESPYPKDLLKDLQSAFLYSFYLLQMQCRGKELYIFEIYNK